MIYAFKVLMKEPYRLLKKKEGRKFLGLCIKVGDAKRHTEMEVDFFGEKIKIADSWSFLWQYFEIFYRESYYFGDKAKEPLIIDCGANIGLSLYYFKIKYPRSRIIAFEPGPEIFPLLKNNISNLSDVILHEKAVWTSNEGIYFSSATSDTGHVVEDKGTFIPSVRLKDVLEDHDTIDLLKIDIEGAEFEVLKDCSGDLDKVKNLFVEIHFYKNQPQHFAEILKIIEDAGFRYFIENENDQVSPLSGNWKVSDVNMDVQLNVFATKQQ